MRHLKDIRFLKIKKITIRQNCQKKLLRRGYSRCKGIAKSACVRLDNSTDTI